MPKRGKHARSPAGVAEPVGEAANLGFGPLLLRLMAQEILDREIFSEIYA